uniref:Uncharacterized protein n=1 Tax=Leersia perrieri TaxID=77586 RepID=A0A0D9WYX3_9ORYZ
MRFHVLHVAGKDAPRYGMFVPTVFRIHRVGDNDGAWREVPLLEQSDLLDDSHADAPQQTRRTISLTMHGARSVTWRGNLHWMVQRGDSTGRLQVLVFQTAYERFQLMEAPPVGHGEEDLARSRVVALSDGKLYAVVVSPATRTMGMWVLDDADYSDAPTWRLTETIGLVMPDKCDLSKTFTLETQVAAVQLDVEGEELILHNDGRIDAYSLRRRAWTKVSISRKDFWSMDVALLAHRESVVPNNVSFGKAWQQLKLTVEAVELQVRAIAAPIETLMSPAPAKRAAHVVVYPWPVQGHINCMLHFANNLLGAGIHVTFLHSDHTLPAAAAAASPRLRYVSIPDGLPDGHPRNAGSAMRLIESVQTQAGAYSSLLASLVRGGAGGSPPVTCVVADGLMPFAVDIAEELGIPALSFRTASACSFLAYLSVPRLFELGELPFKEGDDLDMPVRGVPGMESFLRRRDLPSLCRTCTDLHNNPNMKRLVDFTSRSRNARALVLNTAASMEASAVAHIAPHMRDVFAIGPLHAMSPAPTATTSVWREDDGCLAWLDGQPDRSVVYVSLGSLAVISLEQFTELLSGLVAAGYPFLWVLRSDMVADSQSAALRETITAAGDKKARVVEWAPQRDVLRHRALGCFLTHAGWNSTVEAAVEGVPMVCWPSFVDQQINSRFVGAVWRTGLDMKDVCDAAVVAKMVREAMESTEIRASAQALSQKVRQDVSDGGSSAAEFKRLIAFIEELSTVGRLACARGHRG